MIDDASDLWRRIVPPLAAGFAVFLLLLRYAFRNPAPPPTDVRPSWGSYFRYLGVTVASGYVVMLAIVLVFHVVLARDHGALRSAAAGGAALLAIVMPVFFGAEWVSRRTRS
jgi:Family of unknown function (DUF6256)